MTSWIEFETAAHWRGKRLFKLSTSFTKAGWKARRLSRREAVGDALFQSKYGYLGSCDFGWPQNCCEPCCDGDLLCPIDGIGNDAAANRAADFLAPQFAPVCCVKHVEISAHVPKENEAARRRRHAALNGIIRLCPPSPSASVGVNGVGPTCPIERRVRLTKLIERVDRCFAGPRFAGRHGGDFLGRHQRNGGAPFDLADEHEVQLGIVSRTIPLGTAERAGTEVDGFADLKRRVLVLHPGDRQPVETTHRGLSPLGPVSISGKSAGCRDRAGTDVAVSPWGALREPIICRADGAPESVMPR
jgi:hypothetical protein